MAPAAPGGPGATAPAGRPPPGGAPKTVRAASLNRFYRHLLRCQDLGFEANGELVNAGSLLAAAASLQRQRRLLEQRGLELLCATCQLQAGPRFLAAQALATDQRLALTQAAAQTNRAAAFVRTLNGVIEASRAWLRAFLPGRGGA